MIKKEKTNIAISAHGNSIRIFRKIMEKKSKDVAVKWNIPYSKVFVYSVYVKKSLKFYANFVNINLNILDILYIVFKCRYSYIVDNLLVYYG